MRRAADRAALAAVEDIAIAAQAGVARPFVSGHAHELARLVELGGELVQLFPERVGDLEVVSLMADHIDEGCIPRVTKKCFSRTQSDGLSALAGIAVSVTGGFSNVLNERIEKQIADRKLEVDMAFFQTVQDFATWKKQGKLLVFKPEGFDQILPNFRDEDGAYMALSANALTYAYNTSQVRAEDAPKSAQDFLKPMFAGRVITVYPADDDAALYLFHLTVQKYGWGWMDKYMATKPTFIQGHLPVARSVASGESIATFDASSSVWPFKRRG